MSAALKPPAHRMTAQQFLAWTEELADHARYELVDGEAVAMAPETLDHGRLKYRIARRLSEALERRDLPFEVLVDSVGVQADERHVFIPDVLVRCGEPPSGRDRIVDPLVVIEIVSPSTRNVGEAYKLIGYFARPSTRHYLIVYPDLLRTVHHERREDGVIVTHLLGDESISLDPPGIVLAGAFPPAEEVRATGSPAPGSEPG